MTMLLPLLLSVSLAAPFGPGADRSLVDRVIASVDRELVLASEVLLTRELATLDPGPLSFW